MHRQEIFVNSGNFQQITEWDLLQKKAKAYTFWIKVIMDKSRGEVSLLEQDTMKMFLSL